MPRTWSNAKRPPAVSPVRRAKPGLVNSLNLFTLLLIVVALWFFGLVAYTMVHVTMHPITELPHVNAQAPKED